MATAQDSGTKAFVFLSVFDSCKLAMRKMQAICGFHKPSESDKSCGTITKSSRQGDDGLGSTATADVFGEDAGDEDDSSFISDEVRVVTFDAFVC